MPSLRIPAPVLFRSMFNKWTNRIQRNNYNNTALLIHFSGGCKQNKSKHPGHKENTALPILSFNRKSYNQQMTSGRKMNLTALT